MDNFTINLTAEIKKGSDRKRRFGSLSLSFNCGGVYEEIGCGTT